MYKRIIEIKDLSKIRHQFVYHQNKIVTNFRQNSLGKRGNTGFFKYTKNAICHIWVIVINVLLFYTN